MKTFMAPKADVMKFDLEDILTASGEAAEPTETECPEYWPYAFPDENCIS